MNYKEIKEIVDDFGNAKIDEISIEFPDGTKVSMKKNTAPVMPKESVQYIVPTPAEKTEVVANKAENAKEEKEDYKVVKSPMVGTFYSKSSPKAKPYVEVGSKVKKGDILCIVEAMKLMNEIESEFDGEVVEVCVKDGDMVDYGKPLFKLK
jgi:acetyl-CoA carboxylase biotin carboxyl carrier protein